MAEGFFLAPRAGSQPDFSYEKKTTATARHRGGTLKFFGFGPRSRGDREVSSQPVASLLQFVPAGTLAALRVKPDALSAIGM